MNTHDTPTPTASSMAVRQSSFFSRAIMSLARTGGRREASVEDLRGTKGADFEGLGKIIRRGGGTFELCNCFARAEEKKDMYLVIKGPFCFVFVDIEASSPKFAVGLQGRRPNLQKGVVLLETLLGDVEYEISFSEVDTAKEFMNAVLNQAETAQAEVAQKRLGHEHLLHKRESIIFAEQVAKTKEHEQPDAPMTTQEVMANMPGLAY